LRGPRGVSNPGLPAGARDARGRPVSARRDSASPGSKGASASAAFTEAPLSTGAARCRLVTMGRELLLSAGRAGSAARWCLT
jgi:hypothetical protein